MRIGTKVQVDEKGYSKADVISDAMGSYGRKHG